MSRWRDLMCGEVRPEHVGRRMTLSGWVDARRDHGGLVFIDLRDKTGLCQLVVNPEQAPAAARTAHASRNEFVLRADGEVVARAPEAVNPRIATGAVELLVRQLEIVSRSTPLPFQLDEEGVDETLRLRYRWLDLRRPRMQQNIELRARTVGTIRRVMDAAGFLDIQTPILFKPTPEGARDFVVPSRLHPGRFFALPQSPQILKQLLVIGGFDRYYQIAICFRDEDLRADRVQEITQLDVEMAFPDRDELFALMERMCAEVWRECLGVELATPFRRITHDEAELAYGSDKPDLRFGLEIEDVTEPTRGSELGVFASAPCVRLLRVPRAFSRGELARLEDVAREWGAKGLAYLVNEDGEVRSPIAKFLSAEELEALAPESGSSALFGAGKPELVARVLGQLRLHLGRELGLVDEGTWELVWITDFPLFEWDDEERRFTAVHHPFTRPTDETRHLLASDPGAARALAYDLVVNGIEIGGGSFRIHEPALQAEVFEVLELSPDDQRAKFGFLLDALAMGAPPHGGIAFGIERMLMALCREPNLRDVIAFPKNQTGLDPMSGAPTPIEPSQLDELGIRLKGSTAR
jgi:aspartyl-tRNA synthetase